MKIIWMLFALLVIFNIVDVYQTWMLINLGVQEANPLVKLFITKFGIVTEMILIKIIVFSFLLVIILKHNTFEKGNRK